MKKIEAKIDLYNLTPKKAEPMSVTNITYHLSGTGNRVAHGDDHSVTDVAERREILEKLDQLRREKSKAD